MGLPRKAASWGRRLLALVSGSPGSPDQWLGTGRIQAIMDRYAREHRGLAPVVVMPDATGPEDEPNMCMDSELAQAETCLSQDVPNWISQTLRVDTDPKRWAIGGFSFGGTCAFQMAAAFTERTPLRRLKGLRLGLG